MWPPTSPECVFVWERQREIKAARAINRFAFLSYTLWYFKQLKAACHTLQGNQDDFGLSSLLLTITSRLSWWFYRFSCGEEHCGCTNIKSQISNIYNPKDKRTCGLSRWKKRYPIRKCKIYVHAVLSSSKPYSFVLWIFLKKQSKHFCPNFFLLFCVCFCLLVHLVRFT